MKLSIVVPCYNEAENIPKLLAAYAEAINRDDIEVVLVNNGSTDETATVIAGLLPNYQNFLRVVTVPINQGYGFGILEGLRATTGEFIGWTHGDLQTPPKDVLTALQIIESKGSPVDVYVKGNRFGRPFFDVFFTWGMSVFETIYMGVVLYDVNAQPNVFHRSFLEMWTNPPHDFALDLYTLYTAKKMSIKIIRYDVPFLKRVHGESKWNTGLLAKWKFIKRTITFSIELKKRLRTK
jgi:polyisoprenyl-phosphate glycosyltransferase